jgi:hypothetical protein
MIEQWVIDRLNPPMSEKLIILADPQRVIRADARAVDGWAKKRGAAQPIMESGSRGRSSITVRADHETRGTKRGAQSITRFSIGRSTPARPAAHLG